MGLCSSKPKVEDDLVTKKNKNHQNHQRRRRRILRRRVSSRNIEANNIANSNSVLQASNRASDAAWFDSASALDSECDEEFYSVFDGVGEVSASHADEVGEDKKLSTDFCGGILPNVCLPCISSVAVPVEKRRPTSPDTPGSRRKSFSRPSFKFREGSSDMTLFPLRSLKHKLVAGSLVPFCPIEKQMPGSWSPIEPSSFRVRGKNYLRDKKKEFAPSNAAFYPLGADLFLSPRKIDHIARFVQIPAINIPGDVPSILIVNIQIPLYPATIFQSENDGDGMNVVLYFKLSERYAKDLPDQFRENITKMINDEVERVKGFPLDTIAPFRERLKILGRVANVENLSLGATEKKLMNAYNEKPVLSRPQHEFYLGENYLEIDLDVHRFSYIARKGFEGFIERLKLCNLDFALTIQGNKPEDLPEHLLCAIRLNKLDYNNFNQIGF
ncbi:hypothetical protein TanjilG_04176 [Lupinus angustifolius]|uniref:Protein ENHANCED DISEASE RESISTANCE 2 C-terminal domain-containing protein n=1 Tax=Lupinus angustifolius TaxID=3871 RepID=A0A4P1RJQ5_LUPAN|nr:PREDICTED: uncharacterized protein LOC109347315 [Lupinus angustifolius]OIW12427.1 hypothetical protein TanjilG_04176 [Lupinus angustifolius]